MTKIKHILLAAVAAPAMIVAVAPAAHAQVAGIATADPVFAILRSKAYAAANAQIRTTFADAFTRLTAKQTERQGVLAQMDKNGDKQVDDAEQAASPALKAKLDQIEAESSQISMPMLRAKLFAVEMILQRYGEAQKTVVTAKKINVILSPEAFVYAPEGADVTAAITTELDRILPSVPITAPNNYGPSDEAIAVLQRLIQIENALAQQQRAAQPAGGTPPAGQRPPAPPTTGARPATTPPTTPPPGR